MSKARLAVFSVETECVADISGGGGRQWMQRACNFIGNHGPLRYCNIGGHIYHGLRCAEEVNAAWWVGIGEVEELQVARWKRGKMVKQSKGKDKNEADSSVRVDDRCECCKANEEGETK